MNFKQRIEIENKVLDKIAGRVFLLQVESERKRIVIEALQEVLSEESYKNIKEDAEFSFDDLVNSIISYGVIDELLADPLVEDIMINYLSPVLVHSARQGLVVLERSFSSQEELELFIKKLIVFSGRREVKKINNVELTGLRGRANIIFSPLGYQITITRAKERVLSIVDLVELGTLNSYMAAQLWLYVEGFGIKPANIIIAGGPGVGKSTLLNSLFTFIPRSERIVVIEDTLELNTERLGSYSRLTSDDDMSLESLVKNSLRMRPDRIIVGEVRGEEAKDLITALLVGKYGMGTIHAATSREIITRMTSEPMNTPEVLIGVIDVFVIMRQYRIHNKTKRVINEICEVSGMEKGKVLLSSIWGYNLFTDSFKETAVGGGFRDRLAELSGRSPREIMDEIRLRALVIEAMLKKGIKELLAVSDVVARYFNNPSSVLSELGI